MSSDAIKSTFGGAAAANDAAPAENVAQIAKSWSDFMLIPTFLNEVAEIIVCWERLELKMVRDQRSAARWLAASLRVP
jgi:hypothetical protein